MSSGFLFIKNTFSMYSEFEPEGKLARTDSATEVSEGMTILVADRMFQSFVLNLVLHLNF